MLISKPNPEDLKFIVLGSIVWLRSGSPPLKVIKDNGGKVIVECKDFTIEFPKMCLTPEPTPVNE